MTDHEMTEPEMTDDAPFGIREAMPNAEGTIESILKSDPMITIASRTDEIFLLLDEAFRMGYEDGFEDGVEDVLDTVRLIEERVKGAKKFGVINGSIVEF